MGGNFCGHAHADPHDIGAYHREGEGIKIEPYVPRGHQGGGGGPRLGQDAAVGGYLHVDQPLVEPVDAQAWKPGERDQGLSYACVGGKPPALSPGVQDEALGLPEPGE